MEASDGNVRGVIDTLIKVVGALDAGGIALIGDNARSEGGAPPPKARRVMLARCWTMTVASAINATTPPARIPEAMKQFFLKLFTWWNSETFGTQLWTALYGELVGTDEEGNRYYRTKGGKIDPTLGFERRWVIYNGYAEASRIPPSWHGWMHHTVDVPPTAEKYEARAWEKPHQPNLTGTAGAYRPSGSTLASGRRPKATGDYTAWTPGQ